MEKREHRDQATGSSSPAADPLDAAHIEGQNPDTPQRLPGYTRFYHRNGASAASNVSLSSALIMAVALAALATLILMLAAAG